MIGFITHNNSFFVFKIQFSFQKLNTWFSPSGCNVFNILIFMPRVTFKQSQLFILDLLFLVLIQIQWMYVTFRIVFPDFPIAKIITRERSKCRTVLAWLTLVGTRLSAQWRKKLMFLLQSHILEASSQRIWR